MVALRSSVCLDSGSSRDAGPVMRRGLPLGLPVGLPVGSQPWPTQVLRVLGPSARHRGCQTCFWKRWTSASVRE
jgi:hypothetical protein